MENNENTTAIETTTEKQTRQVAQWFIIDGSGTVHVCGKKSDAAAVIEAYGFQKVIKGFEVTPTTETKVVVSL